MHFSGTLHSVPKIFILQNVDVLFNCAGFVHQGSILECPESEWDRSFELNVKAVYKMCKAFIPNVREISEMKHLSIL